MAGRVQKFQISDNNPFIITLNWVERNSNYGQFGAMRTLLSWRMTCKTYIFINSNLLSYKNWKQS